MAYRRIRTPSIIKPSRVGKRTRIIIPQPADRPLRIKTRDVVQREEMQKDPWWFVFHRRGVVRPRVGLYPLEARAVSKGQIAGTLPERIVYKYLTSRLRFVSGVDFDFQSSLQGGRMELGGIVADFLFPFLKIIINPLGPTHDQYLRGRKDTEQISDLKLMGYEVYMIPDEDVYDEYVFEEWMRRIFNLFGARGGGSPGAYGAHEADLLWWERLYVQAESIYRNLQRQMGI